MSTSLSKRETIRSRMKRARSSPLRSYKELTTGEVGWGTFIGYELATMLLAPLPGAVGFLLRQKAYRHLFGGLGRGLVLGRNVVVRHPASMRLGDEVTIDDGSLIDARGAGPDGFRLGDGVIINRNCMLQAKSGPLVMGPRCSLGSNSVIVSISGVELGTAVLFAGNCYLSAGAYPTTDLSRPIMDQEVVSKGPIRIGDGAWLGTGVIVLDGVTIGAHAVIGAGAVVTRDVPERGIAVGVPARVVGKRG